MKKDVLLLLVCVMLCAGCEQTKEERMKKTNMVRL